jgi:hypothetical protein
MQDLTLDLAFDYPPADVLDLDITFWKLYESSFPASEREPRDVILKSVRAGTALAIRARTSCHTIGMATAHLIQNPPIPFLVYLAVSQELRSRKIGAALFENAWVSCLNRYETDGLKPVGIVWEVEIPERAPNDNEVHNRQRRIAFFTRLGAQVLALNYVQPPVDGITTVPMHLMFRPSSEESYLDRSLLSALVRGIYFEKYHNANGIPLRVLQKLLGKSGQK